MIVSALCDYYDVLDKEKLICPYGFESCNVKYEAILSENGDLLDLIAYENQKNYQMPIRLKIPGIAASPVCDNFAYVFGGEVKNGVQELCQKKFECAKELHIQMFENAESKEAKAIKAFFEKWKIEDVFENEILKKHYGKKGEGFAGNIVFKLDGARTYFHENEEIIRLWQKKSADKKENSEEVAAQCSITGQRQPLARIISQVQGVRGANATGASLICMKQPSDSSYGLTQAYNARIGEQTMFRFSTALQYLLNSTDKKLFIGDATTVFWASRADGLCENIFSFFMNDAADADDEEQSDEAKEIQEIVKTILEDGIKGIPNEYEIDENVQFYVLGLSPNAGRISVRFFYNNSFEEFCNKIKQHYDDISIYGGAKGKKRITIGSLLYATISPKSKDKKPNPLLGGAIMRAILTGDSYPQLLLNQTILRVKTEASVTQARAAILKGILNRKNRKNNKKEEITMGLNEENKDYAYILGRTFAVLEMIQKNALGDDINATIKDKFFASACANPALVFPRLIKLAQFHLAKITPESSRKYWDIKLGKLLSDGDMQMFPKVQNMENQGKFILGYYQQTQENYKKREKKEEE